MSGKSFFICFNFVASRPVMMTLFLDPEYKLDATGGMEKVQLTREEMPKHTHAINSGNFRIHDRSFGGNDDCDKPYTTEAS